MPKPVVFFSHSSLDGPMLRRLKELFVRKTGGSLDVFLSSDGESIPLGRNWVHKIEEALVSAKLQVVFVTNNSLKSGWMYFESGFAYSKGIRVIPVGFNGLDLSQITPPMSLLQGFNISNHEGLNNLIALVNQEFEHTHDPSFTRVEYDSLFESNDIRMFSQSSGLLGAIKDIQLRVPPPDDGMSASAILEHIDSVWKQNSIATLLTRSDEKVVALHTHGVSIVIQEHVFPENTLFVQVDPIAFESALHLISLTPAIFCGVTFSFRFMNGVRTRRTYQGITARLSGIDDIRLLDDERFMYRSLIFCLERDPSSYEISIRSDTAIEIELQGSELSLSDCQELIKILFDRGILYTDSLFIADHT